MLPGASWPSVCAGKETSETERNSAPLPPLHPARRRPSGNARSIRRTVRIMLCSVLVSPQVHRSDNTPSVKDLANRYLAYQKEKADRGLITLVWFGEPVNLSVRIEEHRNPGAAWVIHQVIVERIGRGVLLHSQTTLDSRRRRRRKAGRNHAPVGIEIIENHPRTYPRKRLSSSAKLATGSTGQGISRSSVASSAESCSDFRVFR
jgi:hypothetical protein